MRGVDAGLRRNTIVSSSALSFVLVLGCTGGSNAASGRASDTPHQVPDSGSVAEPDSGSMQPMPEAGSVVDPDAGTHVEAGVPLRAKFEGEVFVHLFEWRWSDIAEECEQFLGPKGFAAVQVSPPSEHLVLDGRPWWQRYQTVSYALDKSRSGTKAEFADMVERCAKVGVFIYVDAVVNHMTGQTAGVGSNGTRFTKYNYPNLYTESDFHHPICTIAGDDYANNAHNVQSCELLGLADLDTGQDSVRQKIADYFVSLVRIGVRGFRIDAAKHMAPADLDAILNKVNNAVPADQVPYYFLEVIDGGGEAVHASDYYALGKANGGKVDVTEFRYSAVDDAFLANGRNLASLKTLGSAPELVPSAQAVVFTNNHDTQRASAIWYKDAPYYDLANVFMLAFPYGHPSVMSSFAFDRTSDAGRALGPPSDLSGNTAAIFAAPGAKPQCAETPASAPAGSWVCEHRVRSLANMVGFRKTAGAAPLANWWDNGANQVAFSRGDRGFVAINRDGAPLARHLQTGLAMGTYCDIVSADHDACDNHHVTVDASGFTDVNLAPNTALGIDADSKL